MVRIEDAVVARYSHAGKRFEILVDSEIARGVIDGKNASTDELLASLEVYRDAGRGERVSEKDLSKTFGTTDMGAIASEILKKGEIQFTTEQRRRAVEEKRKQIVDYIVRCGINPQTKSPHPPHRIENAMGEVRVVIDPFRGTEEQALKVISAIQVKIPLKIESVSLEITLDPMDYGKCIALLKHYGNVMRQKWLGDGRFECTIDVPAGIRAEFIGALSRHASGEVGIEEVKR